jgi:hypothetical protein
VLQASAAEDALNAWNRNKDLHALKRFEPIKVERLTRFAEKGKIQ